MGNRVLNTLANIIGGGGEIKFSKQHNALYGLSQFVMILASMCKSGQTATESVIEFEDNENLPTARWFHGMVRTAGLDGIRQICDDLMDIAIKVAKKGGIHSNGPVMIAIDKHEIPRYDKDNMKYLIRSKPKKGTSKFEAYATMQAVDSPVNATLGCIPLTREDFDADFVRKFVNILRKSNIMYRLFLLDREFYSVDIMTEMYRAGKKFLMPAIKNATVKNAIEAAHAAGKTKGSCVSDFTITNRKGKTASFNLVIVPSAMHGQEGKTVVEQYVAFATNLPFSNALHEIDTASPDYRKRWGIETGYRQIEQIRAKTISRNQDIRLLVFFVSVFVYNMWAIERNRDDIWCARRDLTLLRVSCALLMAARRNLAEYGFAGPPLPP